MTLKAPPIPILPQREATVPTICRLELAVDKERERERESSEMNKNMFRSNSKKEEDRRL